MALFAGAGGGILGGKILDWRTVCAVEIDEYARHVLVARQNDGTFDPFPIWDDVRTFDGRPWRGIVDVVSGGFPCQDISIAGKGKGLEGERSGLWSEMARIIGEVRPRYVFVENSPMLVSRGLDRVLADLAALRLNAVWGVVGADDAGASHRRKRLWILAYADGMRELQQTERRDEQRDWVGDCRRWPPEPGVGRVVDGLAHRTHRLKALGNGQVPRVVAMAWRILMREAMG
ncbi:DNA cytosine methyltransferase [Hydrogenimonas urashimensis]|uniref:DNA cytosine methyltransferase n=1 Tax=Hydrogenimonas urashimensis TaxID=2740515 RepID=UPI001915A0BF|nr:DNA cytosine methyltransferase [Hydrogenimonas urashimensis]